MELKITQRERERRRRRRRNEENETVQIIQHDKVLPLVLENKLCALPSYKDIKLVH